MGKKLDWGRAYINANGYEPAWPSSKEQRELLAEDRRRASAGWGGRLMKRRWLRKPPRKLALGETADDALRVAMRIDKETRSGATAGWRKAHAPPTKDIPPK